MLERMTRKGLIIKESLPTLVLESRNKTHHCWPTFCSFSQHSSIFNQMLCLTVIYTTSVKRPQIYYLTVKLHQKRVLPAIGSLTNTSFNWD